MKPLGMKDNIGVRYIHHPKDVVAQSQALVQ